jgi:hypothetical protein
LPGGFFIFSRRSFPSPDRHVANGAFGVASDMVAQPL